MFIKIFNDEVYVRQEQNAVRYILPVCDLRLFINTTPHRINVSCFLATLMELFFLARKIILLSQLFIFCCLSSLRQYAINHKFNHKFNQSRVLIKCKTTC